MGAVRCHHHEEEGLCAAEEPPLAEPEERCAGWPHEQRNDEHDNAESELDGDERAVDVLHDRHLPAPSSLSSSIQDSPQVVPLPKCHPMPNVTLPGDRPDHAAIQGQGPRTGHQGELHQSRPPPEVVACGGWPLKGA